METQARNLAGSLKQQGIPVFLLTRRTSPELAVEELVDDIPVYRCWPVGGSSRLRWAFALTCLPTLFRLRARYDVIFVPGFRALGIPAVLAAKLLGKKSVLKAESSGELSGEFFRASFESLKMKTSSGLARAAVWLRNRLLVRADTFASLSTEQTSEFSRHGVPQERITVIPQSVRTELFFPVSADEKLALRRKLQLPEKGLVVIYTGRIVSYKGVPLLLEIWPELLERFPGSTLLVVGAGGVDVFNCEEQVRATVASRGLEKSVVLTGSVRNVDEYLKASDIFTLPTQNEAFPLSLLEGMACALPSVSTRVGGIPDILEDGRNGLMIEPGNAAVLRDALERLMSSPDLRASAGRAALKTVQDRYTREIVTGLYVDLFCRLTGKAVGNR
jgi:glycosyltransferase involved in cell wall biosynthesis